jgi:predicted nucleotidyltransferase
MKTQNIPIPKQEIALICQKWNIQNLSLFGSVLRDDFTPTSDIDILIEFQTGKTIGFLKLHQLEQELSKIFNGRAIDLVTLKSINHRLCKRILAEAEVYYAER